MGFNLWVLLCFELRDAILMNFLKVKHLNQLQQSITFIIKYIKMHADSKEPVAYIYWFIMKWKFYSNRAQE